MTEVPPLAAEDHVCDDCELRYATLDPAGAVKIIRSVPRLVGAAVRAVHADVRRRRPDERTWSVTEYVCHLRDVYATSTIRLYRARTEVSPVLEPMLNDLRAVRFRYNDMDAETVLPELAANAAGCCDEVDRVAPDGWDRTVTRLPGEERTALWLLRQAAHEGTHHLGDIRAVGRAVS